MIPSTFHSVAQTLRLDTFVQLRHTWPPRQALHIHTGKACAGHSKPFYGRAIIIPKDVRSKRRTTETAHTRNKTHTFLQLP